MRSAAPSLSDELSPNGTRGGALDGLRFAAAAFVVLYHYGAEAPVDLLRVHPVFGHGYLATNFFLILSGFVLGQAYGARLDEGRIGPTAFWLKRVARIWPAHLVVLAMIVAVIGLTALLGAHAHHPARFAAADLLPQALLIQAWGNYGGGGWNLPSWTLSALVICYAAFPVVWRLLRPIPPVLGLALAAGVIYWVNAFSLDRLNGGIYDLPFQVGVLRALPLFILGAAISRFVSAGPVPAGLAMAAAGSGILGLALAQAAGRFDALSLAATALIVAAFGAMRTRRPSRLLAYGGKVSFALFITHVLAAVLWFGVMHRMGELPTAAHWTMWALSFPFALVLAVAFERLIDSPLQARLKPVLSNLVSLLPRARPQPA